MGIVNNTMCRLLEEQLYFVDFWQGAVLQGRYELDGKLTFRDSKEYYARTFKGSGMHRDVLMKHVGRMSCLMAVEILATVDYTIPVRIMEYDSRENKRQLNELAIKNRQGVELEKLSWEHGGEFMYGVKREDRILPIKTVGLYCGNREYDGATDVKELYDMDHMPEEVQAMYNDYPVQIIDMHTLDENVFETGLRELVGVFQRSHDREVLKKYYLENEDRFRRLDDYVIDAMGALIGMNKLRQFKHKDGGIDMCKAFEDERNEGRLEGRESTLLNTLKNLMESLGWTVEQTLQAMKVPETEWEKYRSMV